MMTLQAEYLACRESKSLYDELFTAVYTMAKIQVNHIKKTRRIYLDKDRVDTIAEDASIMIMSRYKNPGWSVHKSFINEISITCAHFMFDKRYKDRLQYRAMGNLSTDVDLDAEAEKSRRISAIQRISIYSEGIVKQAQAAKCYSKYLLYIVARHSFMWIDEHMKEISELWGAYHA